ncbi:hypothetical protein CBS101457_000159 [Exobasidium rhododendri]|nr:hypothetical protein CBS101457_000159 [Exobasidium rhododendri]
MTLLARYTVLILLACYLGLIDAIPMPMDSHDGSKTARVGRKSRLQLAERQRQIEERHNHGQGAGLREDGTRDFLARLEGGRGDGHDVHHQQEGTGYSHDYPNLELSFNYNNLGYQGAVSEDFNRHLQLNNPVGHARVRRSRGRIYPQNSIQDNHPSHHEQGQTSGYHRDAGSNAQFDHTATAYTDNVSPMPGSVPASARYLQRVASRRLRNRETPVEGADESPTPPQAVNAVHWKHTLILAPTFPPPTSHESAFSKLDEDQKLVAIERFHRVRPYSARWIGRFLGRKVLPPDMYVLLHGDPQQVEETVNRLLPADKMKKGDDHIPWMTGLEDWQRLGVIEKMARVTEQGEDDLRDLFVQQKKSPELAWEILASSDQECALIAVRENLYMYQSKPPWMKGASEMQQCLAKQMLAMGGGIKKAACDYLLAQDFVPEGYGLQILRADDDELKAIARFLQQKGPKPSLH